MDSLTRVRLYLRHLQLFVQTYPQTERHFAPLKKFAKVYLTDFQHAQKLRLQVTASHDAVSAIDILSTFLSQEDGLETVS